MTGSDAGRIKRPHWILYAVFLALVAPAGGRDARAEDIRVGGNGSALRTMRLLGDAFQKVRPGSRIVIVPNLGSSGGIKAVSAGAIDIGLSSRALRESEASQGLKAFEYGRNPFVFATSTKNDGAPALTLRQVAEIYAGRMVNWLDGTRIRLVLRPENDSDSELLRKLSPELKEAAQAAQKRPGMLVAITDHDAADSLEKLPGAFGTTSLVMILSEKRALKPLKLDGVEPSARSVADGSYPYWKPMLMVTGPRTGPAVSEFIAFVRSPAGREILTRTGHWVN